MPIYVITLLIIGIGMYVCMYVCMLLCNCMFA